MHIDLTLIQPVEEDSATEAGSSVPGNLVITLAVVSGVFVAILLVVIIVLYMDLEEGLEENIERRSLPSTFDTAELGTMWFVETYRRRKS